MKLNQNTVLRGSRVVLVPYRPEHVQQYHAWMQDPALQEATASEPLSIEEEYAMQQSWASDDDKCTFILLDPALPDTPGTGTHGGRMAGDVNFFLNDPDDSSVAEIEIMVAEASSRRKGLASEALRLFMAYGMKHLGLTKFRAKIGEANAASLALFSKLGYQEVSRSSVFKEVTLELPVEGAVQQELLQLAEAVQLEAYDQVAQDQQQ
jgi:RimJ/RimL family protein N-acetyltransferase